MQITGLIPSRMNSTRFPGKPLAEIAGKPMLLWVYESALASQAMDTVYVATDSREIAAFCQTQRIPCIMTSASHKTPTARIQEVSSGLKSDYYVMLGGDEPLLSPQDISGTVQKALQAMDLPHRPFAVNAMARIPIMEEVLDPSNIKIVCGQDGLGLYASRGPIPFSGGKIACHYHKFVSIGIYTKEALDFFVSTSPGPLEQAEEFDLLRFMEHGKPILFIEITGRTLSVDTPSDLEKVRHLFRERPIIPVIQTNVLAENQTQRQLRRDFASTYQI